MVMDVWATWCGPCLEALPHFAKLAKQYQNDSRIQFVSVSVDEDKSKWLAKLQEEKPTWQQVWLDEKANPQFSMSYQVSSIPRFIIIDAEGKIANPEARTPQEGLDADIKAVLK